MGAPGIGEKGMISMEYRLSPWVLVFRQRQTSSAVKKVSRRSARCKFTFGQVRAVLVVFAAQVDLEQVKVFVFWAHKVDLVAHTHRVVVRASEKHVNLLLERQNILNCIFVRINKR